MPNYIALKIGKRRSDLGFMMDFHAERGSVKVNFAVIDGVIALEEIPMTSNGVQPAVILNHRKWEEIYAVAPRITWKDDDYFHYAVKRFRELSIKCP